MNWKCLAGLDNLSDVYAYAHDPKHGYIAASKVAESWVSTTCGYASLGCGMLVGVGGGKAVAVRGNPAHPVNRGKLCPRGLSEHHTLQAKDQALRPLLKKDGKFRPVTWDEALTTMVARFRGRKVSAGRLCDYSAMTWEAIEAEGGMQWGGGRLYADGKFPSADGCAKLFAIECEPFPEQPNRDFPLILNTGRTVEHWHTRTKTGAVAILDSMSRRAWLEMNPRDANTLGLKAHDDVSIVSRRSRKARSIPSRANPITNNAPFEWKKQERRSRLSERPS